MNSSGRKTTIIGYYGRYNAGDDLMASELAAHLIKDGRLVRIISSAPYIEKLIKSPSAKIVPRKIGSIFISIIWCDDFVVGGGTFFHDSFTENTFRRFARHLWAYAALLCLARFLGKKVHLIGVGIGPVSRGAAIRPTRIALAAAHSIYVRDHPSLKDVQRLCESAQDKTVEGHDLTILAADRMAKVAEGIPQQNRIGLSLIDMTAFLPGKGDGDFWEPFASALVKQMEKDPTLQLSIFAFWTAPNRANDIDAANQFITLLPTRLRDRIEVVSYDGNPQILIERMAACRAILATRFHAAVFAHLLRRPFATICYNRKVSDFATSVGLPKYLKLHEPKLITLAFANEAIDRLLEPRAVDTPTQINSTHTASMAADVCRAISRCLENAIGQKE